MVNAERVNDAYYNVNALYGMQTLEIAAKNRPTLIVGQKTALILEHH